MKKQIAVVMGLLLAFTAASCGSKPAGNNSGNNSGSGVGAGADPRLLVVEGLAEDMYPNLERMDKLGEGNYTGRIDVDLVFGKTKPGWEAVARAYEKIQPGVVVELNEHSDSTYKDNVTNAAMVSNTEWDIFQGNRLTNVEASAINLSSKMFSENHYAGIEVEDAENVDEGASKMWQEVLTTDAYITDKSGQNASCYIMNSESLSTAWFVNKTAFDDAVEQGYKNTEGKAEMPVTWDDLINLCGALSQAGYRYPLGLAGDSASVNESQFAWLFRVYGDQYYREMYPSINVQEGDAAWSSSNLAFDFSAEDKQPEANQGYNPSLTRFWNSILDENNAYNEGKGVEYVGAKSDKFACFLENLYKIRDYIPENFTTAKFEEVRDAFISFNNKNSPVVLLDYTGFGLTFGTEDRGFEIDFFDYPYMTCSHDIENKHVTTDFVRDVGGNGGYLSIMQHKNDPEQNNMNIDFLKFFMSPYGQSIYYQALQSQSIAPDGLSTVLDFAVPLTWKQFFESDKIQFNGLCDMNWYNNNFIYHVNGQEDSRTAHKEVVHALYKTGRGTTMEELIAEFQNTWDEAVRTGYNKLCESMRWNKNMWQSPGADPNS